MVHILELENFPYAVEDENQPIALSIQLVKEKLILQKIILNCLNLIAKMKYIIIKAILSRANSIGALV